MAVGRSEGLSEDHKREKRRGHRGIGSVLRPEPGCEPLLIQSHYVIQTKHLILSSSPSVSQARPDLPPSLPPSMSHHGFVITCLGGDEGKGGDRAKTEEDIMVTEDEWSREYEEEGENGREEEEVGDGRDKRGERESINSRLGC